MVLRLLRGESLEALSREAGVEIYRLDAWRERAGCIAGALHETDYRKKLADVGFEDIEIEPTRIYSGESGGIDAYMSAFIRGTKPSE